MTFISPSCAALAMRTATNRTEYKVIVAPTREGWRYVPQMRRSRKHPWMDFPPYRSFTTRAEAEDYVEGLEQ